MSQTAMADIDDAAIREDLTQLFRIESLSEEEQDAILEATSTALFEITLSRAYDALVPKDRKPLSLLLEGKAEFAEIFSFIESKVPHFHDIYREEAKKLQAVITEN